MTLAGVAGPSLLVASLVVGNLGGPRLAFRPGNVIVFALCDLAPLVSFLIYRRLAGRSGSEKALLAGIAFFAAFAFVMLLGLVLSVNGNHAVLVAPMDNAQKRLRRGGYEYLVIEQSFYPAGRAVQVRLEERIAGGLIWARILADISDEHGTFQSAWFQCDRTGLLCMSLLYEDGRVRTLRIESRRDR